MYEEIGLLPSQLKRGYWISIDNEFNRCFDTFKEAQEFVEKVYHQADCPIEYAIIKIDYQILQTVRSED